MREGRAHVGELHQVVGAGLDVGAHVEQQHRRAGDRDRKRQRRPVDAAAAPDVEQARRERAPGRARGHEGVGASVGHRPRGLDDRCTGGGAHGARRLGRLGDRHGRVDHVDTVRDVSDFFGRTEDQGAMAALCGQGGAGGYLRGPEVGAVGIDRNGDRLAHDEGISPRRTRSPR
jgi:hypothetical protein